MADEFEKYLKQNRDQFEKGSPRSEVWQKLQQGIIEHHQTKTRIIKMRRIVWGVAAGLLLFIGMGVILIKNNTPTTGITKLKPAGPSKQNDIVTIPIKKASPDSQKIKKDSEQVARVQRIQKANPYELTNDEYNQSIYYYTRLIEIRQRQIGRLQVADPDIYKESKDAIDHLNTVYDQLKKQLPGSINQEKVLELMIGNLQMQEKILNNQLQIIKEMRSSNNHEKSVKDI